MSVTLIRRPLREDFAPPLQRFTPRTVYYLVSLVMLLGTALLAPLNASIASLVLTILGVAALCAVDLRAVLVLSYPIVSLAGVLVSVALIENGAYVSEQFRYGFNAGASATLACYVLGFLIFGHLALTLLLGPIKAKSDSVRSRPYVWLIVGASITVGVFYSYLFLTNGSGLDFTSRFEWIQALPEAAARFHSAFALFLIPALFGLAGYYWHGSKRNRTWMLVLFIPVVSLVLTGEKFSGFALASCLALTGIGLSAYARGEAISIRFRYIVVLVAASAMLLVLVFAGYQRLGYSDGFDFLARRLALQGHVWFGIVDRFHGTAGVSILDVISTNSLYSPAGLDLISYQVSSPEFVFDRLATGVTFTMGGAPSMLAAFGLIGGFAAYSVLGALNALVVLPLYIYLRGDRVLAASAAFGLLVIAGLATQMGRWDTVYGTISLTLCGFLLSAGAVERLRRKHRSKP